MKKRLISAFIALLIFIPLTIKGGFCFKIGITILSLISLWEIIRNKKELPLFIKLILYLLMILIIFVNINILIPMTLTILMILLIFYDRNKYNILDFSFVSIFIILFINVFSYIINIRNEDVNILIYLLLITILTDTFAFFGGKLFGKHKLVEKISPKKTIEGSIIGSFFGTMISSIYYIYMVDPGINISIIIIITLILSLFGQLGDLVFSQIKRFFNLKDFSNIMPGHGGVLDRIDSLIMVTLVYQIIINII